MVALFLRSMKFEFCNDLNQYQRFGTLEVQVGSVSIGGDNPVRIQSMTTADTMDTQSTVDESVSLIQAGAELVRITAPSKKEAKNLELIKNELNRLGYNVPLVADIHFTPNAAEIAAGIVEKVRINPGNYADKKKFTTHEYDDESYAMELIRIKEKFNPLIDLCKKNGTAMRIGTNHGSLSDRIMSRYGDSPLGMVESALEFLRIAQEKKYDQIVLSMKASNPQVMVQAYRLLVKKMKEEGMNYPLHLGVTEAGEGEDGRIKSAMGIGTLLEDGIGDTIRVSLTEDPEHELPVCKMIANRYVNGITNNLSSNNSKEGWPDFYGYSRRQSKEVERFGGEEVPKVIADLSSNDKIEFSNLKSIGYHYLKELDKWALSDEAADAVYLGNLRDAPELPPHLMTIYNYERWLELKDDSNSHPLLNEMQYLEANILHPILNFVSINTDDVSEKLLVSLENNTNTVLLVHCLNDHPMRSMRALFIELQKRNISTPVVLHFNYRSSNAEEIQVFSSIDAGALLLDGFGDGLMLGAHEGIDRKFLNSTAFGILQASRTRISRTEYIACPSCGRTLFNLQETTAKIKQVTSQLKGVKIGIMGCIVNGPGEMADADFGYVGSGPGKITLYKGQEVVKRNVPEGTAVIELVNLIKENGMWLEPKESLA